MYDRFFRMAPVMAFAISLLFTYAALGAQNKTAKVNYDNRVNVVPYLDGKGDIYWYSYDTENGATCWFSPVEKVKNYELTAIAYCGNGRPPFKNVGNLGVIDLQLIGKSLQVADVTNALMEGTVTNPMVCVNPSDIETGKERNAGQNSIFAALFSGFQSGGLEQDHAAPISDYNRDAASDFGNGSGNNGVNCFGMGPGTNQAERTTAAKKKAERAQLSNYERLLGATTAAMKPSIVDGRHFAKVMKQYPSDSHVGLYWYEYKTKRGACWFAPLDINGNSIKFCGRTADRSNVAVIWIRDEDIYGDHYKGFVRGTGLDASVGFNLARDYICFDWGSFGASDGDGNPDGPTVKYRRNTATYEFFNDLKNHRLKIPDIDKTYAYAMKHAGWMVNAVSKYYSSISDSPYCFSLKV